MYGYKKAEVNARNTKMNRIEQTCHTKVNARNETNWANSSIGTSKSAANTIFCQIFSHQGVQIDATNTRMNRCEETHPIMVNATYEMNWANFLFFKKFQNMSTEGGRSGGRLIQYIPIPPEG